MKLGYKKLGDYIRLVDERNRNLEVETLLGVSIRKVLMPSIANTIGTDMSTYKIIRKNQFAYGTVTSRNGDKISIALLKEFDKALVSQIYLVFEVINESLVLPDYLMMWFRRPEFDRYARFKSHGSARETFEWAEMLETELPIPSLEKQKELIEEYGAIENRIQLNKKLCTTLEETAQTIYKHWFEDFEFPVSRHCEEEGTTDKAIPSIGYKSSGGEMVECEELGKEIPKGWKMKAITDIAQLSAGGDRPEIYSEIKTDKCPIPIYSNGITDDGLYGFTDEAKITKKCITISARGTIGFCVLRDEPFVPIVRLIVVIPKNDEIGKYLFDYLNRFEFDDSGSVQNQLTVPQLLMKNILIPDSSIIKKYHELTDKMLKKIKLLKSQTQKLEELKSLLLGKMAVEV